MRTATYEIPPQEVGFSNGYNYPLKTPTIVDNIDDNIGKFLLLLLFLITYFVSDSDQRQRHRFCECDHVL